MKPSIHPTYCNDAQVICACGNKFVTGSTKKNITVEVCYKCHPFYTGQHRYLDVKRRVDSFQKKQAIASQMKKKISQKKIKKTEKEEKKIKTLKELLSEV